jgi:SEC-C motif-containing protein
VKPSALQRTASCPCRGPSDLLPLESCCARYHAGALYLSAPTPEALMRSRYSAFVLNRIGYLLHTWHSSKRPSQIDPSPEGLRWLGLEVRRSICTDPNHATVEFVARSKLGGRAQRLHEISSFVREDGRWLYLDALRP